MRGVINGIQQAARMLRMLAFAIKYLSEFADLLTRFSSDLEKVNSGGPSALSVDAAQAAKPTES